MRDLTPVGLSADSKALYLISDTGEEFRVTIDHRFRTVLRGDPAGTARLGQLEIKMESALRPREIQDRIRAGETVEEVAAAARTTVEAITGFATPVLAERAYIADLARRASLRGRAADGAAPNQTLDQAYLAGTARLGVSTDEVTWDAWRRDDGRWTVEVTFATPDRSQCAEFVYDQRGRYVVADNSAARTLVGLTSASAAAPRATASRAVRALSTDEELPLGDNPELGDDAIRLVHSAPVGPGAEGTPAPSSTEESDTLAAQADEPTTEMFTPASAGTDPMAGESAGDSTPPAQAPAEPAAQSDPDGPGGATPSRGRRKGRSSMPSWDEIMFGSGASEQ